TVIDFACDIIETILGPEAVLHWEGSPQGILQKLQSRDGQASIFVRDEYSGLLSQMNRGGHQAGLPQLFIRAFDGGSLQKIRKKKREKKTGEFQDDTDTVHQPYLVKLCASTLDSFLSKATVDNVLDGFLPRFVILTASAEPQQMRKTTPELA